MNHRINIFILIVAVLWARAFSASAAYVLPQLGGGQVVASMKHADITFDGTGIGIHVDSSVPTPWLRPLQPPDQLDPSMPWSVLQGKAHNFQYGWNPAGFWAPPNGTAVWIEHLAGAPELESYFVEGPPPSTPYDPIFTTGGSSTIWKWSGSMTHNAYAVLNPTENLYQATYKVYLGNESTGAELPEYQSAEVTFYFHATPILNADFNGDGQVDGADLERWVSYFSSAGDMTRENGDADDDQDVDGKDYLDWQRQYGSGAVNVSVASASVPEPAASVLSGIGVCFLLLPRRGRGWFNRDEILRPCTK